MHRREVSSDRVADITPRNHVRVKHHSMSIKMVKSLMYDTCACLST